MAIDKFSRKEDIGLGRAVRLHQYEMRERKIKTLLRHLNLKGIQKQAQLDIYSNADYSQDGPQSNQQLQLLFIQMMRLSINELFEAAKKHDLDLNLPDLIPLKQSILSQIGGKDMGESPDGYSEMDLEMLYCLQELQVISYQHNHGPQAIEKIAMDAVASQIELEKARQWINSFCKQINREIKTTLNLREENEEELIRRIDVYSSVSFLDHYKIFDKPNNFVNFLLHEMNRLAIKEFDHKVDFLLHSSEMRKKIKNTLQKRYGAIMRQHSEWMADTLQFSSCYSGSLKEYDLWDGLFDYWQSQVFDAYKIDKRSHQIKIETDFSFTSHEQNNAKDDDFVLN